jgi:hypothetical protein
MSFDCHAIGDLGGAGSDGAKTALRLHNTEPAATERLHPFVLTEGGHLNFQRTQGAKDGEALLKAMQMAVDGYLKQDSNSSA